MRVCRKCGIELPSTRKATICTPCHSAYIRERRTQGYYQVSSAERRDMNYRTNYGISLTEYERIYHEQQGQCKSCHRLFPLTAPVVKRGGGKDQLVIHQDHKTGKVTSLLCQKCNYASRILEKYPPLGAAMIAYLEKYA